MMRVAGIATVAVLLLAGLGAAVTTHAVTHGCAGTPAAGDRLPTIGGYTHRQLAHAVSIIQAGAAMKVPPHGWVIAIATALQESDLRVYANDNPAYPLVAAHSMALPHDAVGHDHDSVGLFQQRPSPPEGAGHWGTVTQLMNPTVSARKFYHALLTVKNWQRLPLTVAAQQVQHSAVPDAYATGQDEAARLVDTLAPGALRTASGDLARCVRTCPTGTGGSGQADGCRRARAVLARAARWLTAWHGGPVPYASSADPASWFHGYRRDCSGYASMALGLPGPGLDTPQLAARSTAIPKSALRAGDLLINPASGTAGHVVIFDHWTSRSHTAYLGYEQSADGGTHHRIIPYPYFADYPMTPVRVRR